MTALDRDGADRTHHIRRYDLDDAKRGTFERETEPLCDRHYGGARSVRIKRYAAADQTFCREASEHQVGIGDRRALAAFAVTGRPRISTGAQWADLEQAVAIEPGDRAAARADRVDIHHRQANGKAGHRAVEAQAGLVVADKGDVRARASHVEGYDVRMFGGPRAVNA